jgi:nucleoside-diphosphate-sugar epimerase
MSRLSALRPQAVVDLSSYASEWTRIAVEAFAGSVDQYIYVSSGAVYAPSAELPWPESSPIGPDPYWGQYGQEKVQSERVLQDAHGAGRMSVTVFRYPFVMGPGNYGDREAFVLSRLEAGRPILLPGGGTAINQYVYVDDAAGAIIAALHQPEASSGQAYNCAFRRGITNRGFVELCAAALATEANVVNVDEEALGFPTDKIDLNNVVFPFPNRHYMLAVDRLAADLGFEARVTTRRMVEEFVARWPEVTDHSPKRYEREEVALAALGLESSR